MPTKAVSLCSAPVVGRADLGGSEGHGGAYTPPGSRATPRAGDAVTAFGVDPSCLRTFGAARSACPVRAPRRNGRGSVSCAPTCCNRLCESVPASTLAIRCQHITKDGSRARRPATLMELPCHASSTSSQVAARGVLVCRWGVDLARIRERASEAFTRSAESATSPFGTGGPCVLGLS